ncbi:MAG: LapA family protein [Candidatus Eisenbacteria bacterium]|nr:LapA family protein [Candidatus Eisenbacteria bacterium]
MLRIISSFLLLLILLLVLGIAVLNPSPRVALNLYFGTFRDVPLVLALFIAFLLGSVLTFFYLLGHTFRLRLRIREMKNRNRDYERELIAIRNIPVDPGEALDEEEPRTDPSGEA